MKFYKNFMNTEDIDFGISAKFFAHYMLNPPTEHSNFYVDFRYKYILYR